MTWECSGSLSSNHLEDFLGEGINPLLGSSARGMDHSQDTSQHLLPGGDFWGGFLGGAIDFYLAENHMSLLQPVLVANLRITLQGWNMLLLGSLAWEETDFLGEELGRQHLDPTGRTGRAAGGVLSAFEVLKCVLGFLEILVMPQMINSTVSISELPLGKENTFYFTSRVCSQSTGLFPPLPLSTKRSGCRENSANIGERTGTNLPLKARFCLNSLHVLSTLQPSPALII